MAASMDTDQSRIPLITDDVNKTNNNSVKDKHREERGTKEKYINVNVEKAVLHRPAKGRPYFTFSIVIQTNDCAFSLIFSIAARRYSEFRWLRNTLHENDVYETELPSLPPRTIFRCHHLMDEEFLERRRLGLEDFIRRCSNTPLFKADRAFHLFVQTNLSTSDIDLNLKGVRDDEVIPRIRILPKPVRARLLYSPTFPRSKNPPTICYVTYGESFDESDEHIYRCHQAEVVPKKPTYCDKLYEKCLANASPSYVSIMNTSK